MTFYTVITGAVKKKKDTRSDRCLFFCGEGWIRTTEGFADRFTVCSLWPLGNLTASGWREDLNPQHADYKSAALPVELRQRDIRLTLLIDDPLLSILFWNN